MAKSHVVIGTLAVIGIGAFFLMRGTDSENPDDSLGLLRVGDNALYVSEQKPDTFLYASIAVIKGGGFVVIGEDNAGNPDAIIGRSTLLPDGESQDIKIDLSRKSVHGETLYAMLYADNGNGMFDPGSDMLVKDMEGNIIIQEFFISNDASKANEALL